MGVNVCVVDRDTFEDVPGWDFGRYGGDREIHLLLSSIPHNSVKFYPHSSDGLSSERPEDVEQFRALLHLYIDYNSDRWDTLCDLLKENPNYGIYFSY